MNEMTVMQLEAAKWALDKNLEGMTHDESLMTPEPGGNCINWVLGHLTGAFNLFLPAIGGEALWSEEQSTPYRRGSASLDPSQAAPFEQLRDDFGEAHRRVVARISALTPEQLGAPAPYSPGNNPDETVGSLMSLLAFHQAYHVGQIGVLRRVCGHPGAIA